MSQYIDRKTVLNIVYTQQATRMADAYETLLADFSQMTVWGRGLESDLSHARVEISFLKAEVERLTAEVSFDKRVQLHVDKLVAEFTQCQVERLQAEVERLRKAGDVMADAAYAHCMCQHCEELRDQWRDAKRGNQP